MKFKASLVIVDICIIIAFFLIFKLIFSDVIYLMMWNVAASVVATLLLSLNFAVVKSVDSVRVKNSASLIATNLFGIGVFVWTLIFTFGLGNFKDVSRNLDFLYIGYLILLIISLVLWFMGNRGGALAEASNAQDQSQIETKNDLIKMVLAIDSKLAISNVQLHKYLSSGIDNMKSLPNSKFNYDLNRSVIELETSVDSNDYEEIKASIDKFNKIINLLKI